MAADRPDPTVRIFRWFLLAHLVVWTAIPTLTKPNPPIDVVEQVLWGHEWQLGYTKHPPLPSWICGAAAAVTDRALWAQYMLPQLAVVLAFWAVWRLARRLLPPQAALLSVCLLECCPFYTCKCEALNNNYALYPTWALAVLLLDRALRGPLGHRAKKTRTSLNEGGTELWPWLALGVCLGLGLLTKYTTLLLGGTMLAFGLLHPQARRAWRCPGPYLAIIVATAVFLPHAVWLVRHDRAAVQHAVAHLQGPGGWHHHLEEPLRFGLFQLAMLAPLAVVLVPLAGLRWRWKCGQRSAVSTQYPVPSTPYSVLSTQHSVAGAQPPSPSTPKSLNPQIPKSLLAAVVLVPVAAHLAVAAAGVPLRGDYGSPLWLLAGPLLLACLELRPSSAAWRRTWMAWAAVVFLTMIGTLLHPTVVPYLLGKPTRIHYPGRLLADKVNEVWNQRYGRPLPIVAGDYFLAGNVALFSPQWPRVHQSWRGKKEDIGIERCPWLSDDEFRRLGGAIVWRAEDHPEGLSPEVVRRLGVVETIELPPLRLLTGAPLPPLNICVALVPPQANGR
ncbi:MAG: glycosyltransferase family 39 protein [Thermoguttaceae bacterium]|jgi:hypothetical protein